MSNKASIYRLDVVRDLLLAAFTEKELHRLFLYTPNEELRPLADEFGESDSLTAMVDKVVVFCRKRALLPELLEEVREANRRQYDRFKRQLRVDGASAKVFLSYKRGAEPDERLALDLYNALSDRGHSPFIDQAMTIGTRWAKRIQQEIERSDFLLVLLSDTSVSSEMVRTEVKCAHEHESVHGYPRILPLRVVYTGEWPYGLDAYLRDLQYALWQDERDDELVTRQVLNAVEGVEALPREPAPYEPSLETVGIPRPEPDADPRPWLDLRMPGGVVALQSKFYIRRRADDILTQQILVPGTLTYIRAARQTGKSSLLIRGVHVAREQQRQVAFVDCQAATTEHLTDLDAYLHCLATCIAGELEIDWEEDMWQSRLPATQKMNGFLTTKVLEPAASQVVLAMDEVDRVFGTSCQNDFFGLVRSWYNSAQWRETWRKLTLAMAISTEPYLLIADPFQSPFTVGTKIELQDFDEDQITKLNDLHGRPLSPAQVGELGQLLGGHPYLTRKALYSLKMEGITWEEIVSHAIDERSPFGDHLRCYLMLLHDKPELRRAMKRVTRTGTCPDELILHRLLAAGLIRRREEECVCRCRLYEDFFEKYL